MRAWGGDTRNPTLLWSNRKWIQEFGWQAMKIADAPFKPLVVRYTDKLGATRGHGSKHMKGSQPASKTNDALCCCCCLGVS